MLICFLDYCGLFSFVFSCLEAFVTIWRAYSMPPCCRSLRWLIAFPRCLWNITDLTILSCYFVEILSYSACRQASTAVDWTGACTCPSFRRRCCHFGLFQSYFIANSFLQIWLLCRLCLIIFNQFVLIIIHAALRWGPDRQRWQS